MVSRQNNPTIRAARGTSTSTSNARWNKCKTKIALRTLWSLALVLLLRRQSILEELSFTVGHRHPMPIPVPIALRNASGLDTKSQAIESKLTATVTLNNQDVNLTGDEVSHIFIPVNPLSIQYQ